MNIKQRIKSASIKKGEVSMYHFLIVIEKANINHSAYLPDLLSCLATGAIREEAEKNRYEVIEVHIEGLLENHAEK